MKFRVTAAAALAIVATTVAATGGEADRRAGMKAIAGAAKAISGGQNAAANAQLIIDAAAQIPAQFEANEVSSSSTASPAIWANFGDFTAKAGDLQTAAQAVLAAVNGGGDVAGAARAMGGACGACHQAYRIKK